MTSPVNITTFTVVLNLYFERGILLREKTLKISY
jgi:hypothetical protein